MYILAVAAFRRLPILCLASILTLWATPARADELRQKRVIEDFEDVGTWRGGGGNQMPGAWFAADVFLGASRKESRSGDYVGELRLVPDPHAMPPYRSVFSRLKATLLTATPDGIEFQANAKGREIGFRFILRDTRRRDFTTKPVSVSGDGWKSVRLELGPATVEGWSDIQFPVSLQRVAIETDDPAEGSVFIDDLAFTGRFADADLLAIKPAYSKINHEPGTPTSLEYHVWNSLTRPLTANVRVRLHTAEGRFLSELTSPVSLPAANAINVVFSAGVLPVGAYQADVFVEAENLRATYDDTFGVFTPNGERINRRPMWMGVQDQAIWQGEEERHLHLEWSKLLGSDADRVAGGGTRLEYADGKWAFGGWNKILADYDAAGIDVLFTYFELPSWMSSNPKRNRTPPKDYVRFERHAAEFGKFIAGHPAVKYVQFWNEPDSGGPNVGHGFFHGTREDYLKMFETFSRGFRSTNRTTLLTTGGLTLGDEIAGLSRAAVVDHQQDYDMVAFHAHGSQEGYEERQIKVEGWLNESGLQKRILNSETGERSGYTRAGRFTQAVTLIKKVAYAKSRPASELHLWFTLQDYWDMDPEADDSFGLVTSDNRAKPSFVAYNELIRQLANTDPAGEVDLHPSVRTLRFRRDDGTYVYVCWLKQGEASARLWLRGRSLSARDMFGRDLPVPRYGDATLISLGAGPIYLAGDRDRLTTVPDAEAFVQVAGSVVVDGDEGGRLAVRFKEPQGQATSGRIVFRDETGGESWSAPISVEKGRELALSVPISTAKGEIGERRFELKLEWQANGQGQDVVLPVRVLSAYQIRRLPGNPFSPGVVAAIKALPVIALDQVERVVEFAFDPSITPWRGPKDLSVQARIGHDGGGLYLRFDVTDDKHVQTSFPARLDRGDSVRVGIAGDGGVHILLLGLKNDGEQVIWCERSPGDLYMGRWDTPLRIVRSGDVTTYEAYVPFERLGMKGAHAGQPLRFSFSVNEDDGQRPDRWQRRVRYIRWQNGVTSEPDRLGYGIFK